MTLFHGSTQKVHKPALHRCRSNTDFGRGFYCTTSKEQAEKWAYMKQQRELDSEAILNTFEFDEKLLRSKEFKVLIFENANREWLDFVMNNRYQYSVNKHDIVHGPVANDKLYATLSLYEQGILSAEATVLQLKTFTLFDQLSFHSSQALACLKWLDSSKISL